MILPLTVLLHEGSMGRAYLSVLRHAGLLPKKIILMVKSVSPAGKPVARWLPGSLRLAAAARVQDLRYNHAAREAVLQQPGLVEAILQSVAALDVPPAYLQNLLNWDDGGIPVTRVLVSGYGDPALPAIIGRDAGLVLFTGGGIVPRPLLDLSGTTLLHVHPGALPQVRGADGLLWSLLLRGRPACSCFAMAAGIDTGRLLAVRELEPLRILLRARPPDEVLYAATYAILDPLLRALVLREIVRETGNLHTLAFQNQDLRQGETFHFMHPALRRKALRMLYQT
jgi:hypothetical protein